MAKQIDNLVVLDFQSGWIEWSPGDILIGTISKVPIMYISREVVFMTGNSNVKAVGLMRISNGNIYVTTPVGWENEYAHMVGTIAFLV